ncbi:YugN-like family protein [Actinomycetes bacterium NPDC127524]
MIELSSRIEGRVFSLLDLETMMKPAGYVIGGNWDYDHGCFDYKIDDAEGYQFLRIPFKAIDGQLDSPGVTVELQKPYLLSHVYENGLDQEGNTGNVSASFNQFAEPVDPDGDFPHIYISLGKSILHELEKILID